MKKVILIGGAPTVGKSYVARKLAEELKLPWISTDTIRDQMRQLVRPEDYPVLFDHAGTSNISPEEYLSTHSAEYIVNHQNQESEAVWKGVTAIVETDYVWESFIVEGVAILPAKADELMRQDDTVKTVLLYDDNKNRIRDVIFTRGLWDDADKYPDSVKEKEVEWVLSFNHWINTEAKKYNIPLVKVGNQTDYIDEIKMLINK